MFKINKIIKNIALVFGVITLSLGLSYAVLAWTEPSLVPPGGNVDAPLNVSSTNQSKEGWLGIGGIFNPLMSLDIRDTAGLGGLTTTGGALLNTGGAATGLIVQSGKVGIGTTNPQAPLHVYADDGVLIDAGGMSSEINWKGMTGFVDWQVRTGGNNTFRIIPVGHNEEGIILRRDSGTTRVGIGTTYPNATLGVNGDIRLNTDDPRPHCYSSKRGSMWFTKSGVGVKDKLEVCAKDAAESYEWRVIY